MTGYEYFSTLGKFGSRPGLERVSQLAQLAGRPDRRVNIVHVAGTNGKGSTVSAVSAALTAAGYRTGTFMSPYVLDPRECVRIDGRALGHDEFDAAMLAIKPFADMMPDDPPTEFEAQCVAALRWFAENGCEFVCLEVGMGGLLDATNFIERPLVSVICALSIDHTAWLGDTIEQIAAHKCGIIKPGGVTVAYPDQPDAAMRVIRETAAQKQNRLIVPEPSLITELSRDAFDRFSFNYKGLEFALSMPGEHQVYNMVTAAEAIMALREAGFVISDKNITDSINLLRLPARIELHELEGRQVIIDAGHDLQGVQALCGVLDSLELKRPPVAVAGMLADKEYVPCAALLAERCRSIHAAPPVSPRALSGEEFANATASAGTSCRITAHPDVYRALEAAQRELEAEDTLLICGSFYVAMRLREKLFG